MICGTTQRPIGTLWVEQKVIDLEPPYQREGGVWSLEKKQLFIDSILNKFDIPKLYFHDLRRQKKPYKWAVIDGKQRLAAIWGFIRDDYPIGNTFKFTVNKKELPLDTLPKAGNRFSEFSEHFQEYFKSQTVDVVGVETEDEEDIEELFSRLNNGEPLNASEKRNAKHGAMVSLIRRVAKERFFQKKLGFKDRRGSHQEVAAKFLLLELSYKENKKSYVDLKKRHLDAMVDSHREMTDTATSQLFSRVSAHLRRLERIFDDADHLLSKQSYPQLYYAWIRELESSYAVEHFGATTHTFLEKFTAERIKNNKKDEDEAQAELIEFGRLSQQGTNDLSSMEDRGSILTKYFLLAHPEAKVKDQTRMFTDNERYVIWILANKRCVHCRKSLRSLKDMQADHTTAWAHGGPTTFDNAQCLCTACNASKGKKKNKSAL